MNEKEKEELISTLKVQAQKIAELRERTKELRKSPGSTPEVTAEMGKLEAEVSEIERHQQSLREKIEEAVRNAPHTPE